MIPNVYAVWVERPNGDSGYLMRRYKSLTKDRPKFYTRLGYADGAAKHETQTRGSTCTIHEFQVRQVNSHVQRPVE